ncbi:MAG: hypothetical protein QXJ74_06230 [Nitrososphaera sp.]|uniref:hypothetical protein n=1 Tax=Nitrososphaera sp. TaxID=1971748 RepID=UPI00184454F0|nr:hypothetical protein [Nitrososphaera sp.]NWG36003.1 hypothetical protein [Nitrososphaera sp.]
MQYSDLKAIHWDCAKLLELGVSEQLVRELSPAEARDLLKGIFYLKARYAEEQEELR